MLATGPPVDRPERSDEVRRPGPHGSRLRAALLAVVVALDLAVPAVMAWQASLVVPTFHLDGAFQTASGLFRMSTGQWPGRDFLPYLGIGPLLLLRPVFHLLGADLAASVFASHFVTVLTVQFAVALLVVTVLGRRSRWVFALAAALPLLVLAAADLWPAAASADGVLGSWLGLLETAARPGNSLRPVRAFAPYLLAAMTLAVVSRPLRPAVRASLVGAGAGAVAALWSNDYGPGSAALLLLGTTSVLVARRRADALRPAIVLWAVAVAGYVLSASVATAGHPLPYLTYNFSDVRGDQFWYFGGGDAVVKVHSAGDLLDVLLAEGVVLPAAVLSVVLVLGLRLRDEGLLLAGFAGTAALLGGLAATVGGHADDYFWAVRFWSVVVLLAGTARMLPVVARLVDRRRGAGRRTASYALRRLTAATAAAGLVAVAAAVAATAVDERAALARDPGYTYHPRLGGYLDVRYQDHVGLASQVREGAVEEYMGLLGAVGGPRADLPVDSVIHALGRQRRVFAERMAGRPGLVVTTAPDISWVTWNLSANWWFYGELFRSYLPRPTSPRTLAWTPGVTTQWEAIPCRVRGSGVEVAAPATGLYEVELDYRGPGRHARSFSMVENGISAPAGLDGYVALDPGATTQAFPVYVHEDGGSRVLLDIKDVPSAGEEPLTSLLACTASRIRFPAGARTWELFGPALLTSGVLPYRPTPGDVDGRHWSRGVHASAAAFVVPYSAKDAAALESARTVRFADGDTRVITGLETTEDSIVVRVDGPVLDPDAVGYPRPFWLAG